MTPPRSTSTDDSPPHRQAPAEDKGPATPEPQPADAGEPGGDGQAADAALAEAGEKYLRLAADLDNFRRRKAQELADRSRYASEDAALALLPVLDNLRRAVEHAPEEGADPQLQNGLRMVLQQFETALASIGVLPVETVGQRFDPAVHEAIGGDESDEVEEDTVGLEIQPGYRLHDRLLRPALVRVTHPRHARRQPAE
jgi:molecular chaperone GrpE